MLENRSYDHMLGFADIRGTDAATGEPTGADGLKGMEFNCLAGKRYQVIRGAPDVTVDPGHNFNATLEQLCGVHAKHPNGGPYPDVNNTGFVANMAKRDSPDRAGGIMRCFAPEHVPILTTLAREFAVCDRWFCSMPGPTEPACGVQWRVRRLAHCCRNRGSEHESLRRVRVQGRNHL
jgi:phospholipase C